MLERSNQRFCIFSSQIKISLLLQQESAQNAFCDMYTQENDGFTSQTEHLNDGGGGGFGAFLRVKVNFGQISVTSVFQRRVQH